MAAASVNHAPIDVFDVFDNHTFPSVRFRWPSPVAEATALARAEGITFFRSENDARSPGNTLQSE